MRGHAFLTVDVELVWRHHRSGCDLETLYRRSIEPAGVGVAYQLGVINRHGLKACFFVDPMPAAIFGIDPIRRLVGTIRDAGQEVQLHLHPNWIGAHSGDSGANHGSFELTSFDRAGQRALIERAAALLIEAGAAPPIAFRAGSFAANDTTLDALAELGFAYDSSHNGALQPWPSQIGLPSDRIAPLIHRGVIEVPVTKIVDRPGGMRHFQFCALSVREMRHALDHAIAREHAAVTIVGHSFELADRSGRKVNAIHKRRFDHVCAMLAERRELLPTTWFADRPALRLDAIDTPLPPHGFRRGLRHMEQLWSNWVEERA